MSQRALSGGVSYLEGQGDLVSRLVIGRTRVNMWLTGIINLVAMSPDRPSMARKDLLLCKERWTG